jgi:hypothetical protein
MNDPITLPTPDEIAERIRACRDELAALKKLQRMASTAQAARLARQRREAVTAQFHLNQGEKE